MVPKVRIFSDDEGIDELQAEGVFSGDDSSCISELSQLMKDEECCNAPLRKEDRQESARKAVERDFGVLQGRWGLIQQPARAYEVNTLRRIVYAGIIMHNMILEDQNMSIIDLNHMYSNPASDDKIQALVQKQIDEDMVHQKTILDLALQFDNACTTKEDLRKAYEKCNHIPQESRALIDTFLKEGSDKDYELNLSMYKKAAKLEKQMNAKLAWIHEKYNHRSETHIGGSSSQTHEIGDVYLIAEELHQLHLDEEALRETLEEQTMDEKARKEKIRQKQADDDEYFMEFGVMRIDSDYDSSD
nr:putative nuclease HARBI1 [Tanacetum cinerariifolium]